MAVYKRGDNAVYYMNFTVCGVRVSRSTGKFTKKEAKLVEAVEKKRMMVEGALSPRERAARMLLSMAIEKTYDERRKDNKDGLKSQDGTDRGYTGNSLTAFTIYGYITYSNNIADITGYRLYFCLWHNWCFFQQLQDCRRRPFPLCRRSLDTFFI
jgi:hypothetical protein